MTDPDPPRLLDPASGAPNELRALFQSAERDLPREDELARLAQKLGPVLGPPASPTGSAGGSAGGIAKLAAVAGALVGGAVLVASLTDEVPHETPVSRPAPSVTSTAERADAVAPPVADPTESVAPAVPSASVAPSLAPAPVAPKERRSNAEIEVDLLERARRALGGNPSHALALTTEHKLRFPGGALAQEREVIAIEALRRLGRTDQARLRVDEFSKNYPGSAHRYKLDAGSAK